MKHKFGLSSSFNVKLFSEEQTSQCYQERVFVIMKADRHSEAAGGRGSMAAFRERGLRQSTASNPLTLALFLVNGPCHFYDPPSPLCKQVALYAEKWVAHTPI